VDASGELHAVTDAQLKARLMTITALAHANDCCIEVVMRRRASPEGIGAVEAFIGAPLPKSFARFLTRHNGLALTIQRHATYTDGTPGTFLADVAKLEIYGTTEIVAMTKNFREYIDPPSLEIRHKTMRCFDMANVLGTLDRIVFSTDAVRPNGEYAILHADLGDGEWLADLDTLASSVIADSFDSFLDRALGFMIDTRRGFAYWAPHSRIKLPHSPSK
jgi:hypothetical protein